MTADVLAALWGRVFDGALQVLLVVLAILAVAALPTAATAWERSRDRRRDRESMR